MEDIQNLNDEADMQIEEFLRLDPESDDEAPKPSTSGGLTKQEIFKLKGNLYGIEKVRY